MRKLTGCVLVLCGTLGGLWLQIREERRVLQALRELLSALRRIGDTIRTDRPPLPALLRQSARRCGTCGAFFQTAAGALERGETAEAAWQAAAEELALDEQTRQTLRELGPKLSGDEETARRGVELACAGLERTLQERLCARGDAEKRVAAFSLSGAALVILLLV
jgi:stage III sporulation protein AB